MKYCRNCGTPYDENSEACPNCHINVNQNSNQNNYQYNYQDNYQPKPNTAVDKNEVGYNILAFFIPLVGIILFAVWSNEYPIRAKGCLKWAIISFIINLAMSVLVIILYFLFFTFLITGFM